MKKLIALLSFALLLGTLSRFIPHYTKPTGTILLHQASTTLPSLRLYYTKPYHHSFYSTILMPMSESLHTETTSYVPYTEGFMSQKNYKLLTHTIDFSRPTTCYNYFQTTASQVVANLGPLTDTHFISQEGIVRTPFTTLNALPNIYPNHLIESLDVYYVLGDIVGEYSAQYAILDKATLEILYNFTFPTSKDVIYPFHSALDIKGNAFFVHENGLCYMTPYDKTLHTLNLDFTPTYLVPHSTSTLALHLTLENDSLSLAQINTELLITKQTTLPLPQNGLSLIRAQSTPDYLVLLTHASSHPYYTHYILMYDLNTDQLIYCYGLHSGENNILLDFSFLEDDI